LAMHCPSVEGQFQCLPTARATMVDFLKEMHAPSTMIEYQEAAGSTSALWIEPEKLAQIEAPLVDEGDVPPPPPPRRRPPPYYGPYPPPPPPGLVPPGWYMTPIGPVPCLPRLLGMTFCI